MAYSDPDTVRTILAPDGSTGLGSAAAMSDEALQQAIDEVTSEIDGTLAVRYPVPFGEDDGNPVPALVATIARDSAAYLATLTYRQGNPLPVGHPILLRYQRSSLMLSNIAKGIISLNVGDTPPTETSSGEATVVNPYTGNLFTLEDAGIGPALRDPFRRPCD
jgi:phage gp36-like protein